MHGLPLTYNKDLQEDKEHLFDAVDTLELCLRRRAGMLDGDRASTASGWPAAAADELIAATDLADLLVRAASRSARPTASSPGSCARRSTRAARCPS